MTPHIQFNAEISTIPSFPERSLLPERQQAPAHSSRAASPATRVSHREQEEEGSAAALSLRLTPAPLRVAAAGLVLITPPAERHSAGSDWSLR